MRTESVRIQYTLTDAVYRENVRQATGPTSRAQQVDLPVGDLTPDGREALLAIPYAADNPHPWFTWPGKLSGAPTAIEVSQFLTLQAMAEQERVERAAAEELVAEGERHRAAEERRARLVAALDVWERDLAAYRAAERRPYTYNRHEVCFEGVCIADEDSVLHDRVTALRQRLEEAQAAEVAEAERKTREWIRRIAADHDEPELARAAREGRKLGDRPRLLLERILRTRIESMGLSCPILTTWYGGAEPRDGVPTAVAYEVLDALKGAAATLGEGLPFPVEVSDLMRLDVASRHDAVYRTAVIVTCGPGVVAALCEPLDYEEEEEEEEEED
jgi:hypothetical protein